MIRRIAQSIFRGGQYLKLHPQVLLSIVFVVVTISLFLYSTQQFLTTGLANQERLQKDRIGLMQDSFAILLREHDYDPAALSSAIDELAELNPDITKFRIIVHRNDEFISAAALDIAVVGEAIAETETLLRSRAFPGESHIVAFYIDGERRWQASRSLTAPDGTEWIIFTEISLGAIDRLMAANIDRAYFSLIPVILFIIGFAYWQYRNTDYRYLYLEAEQANKTRDLFTNMITHELRAPLTAMRGYASLIEEEKEATFESRKSATRIRQSTERLLDIVNDLLEVARIQSGRLRAEFTETSVSEVVQNVIFELKPSANQKSISLAHTGTDTPHQITTDSKRLHQILVNLVSNAIKYTNEGRIEVAVTDKRDRVEIRVKDTGMGIAAEDQRKLFAPFFRVEGESMDTITGTGLGMWITKQLIEILGGTVGVESIKEIGTNVVMTFPKTGPVPTDTVKQT